MWMMGYNDGGDFNMPDSFNGRKLRPLMPRVPHPPNPTANPTNYLRSIHGDNFIALNHHQLAMSEQNKRDFHTQQLFVSSRWNPTPEQLQTLEELYRRGTRTPSAEQIQHITAQLRRYGKIEGKNVFYWFQNHKARERQKRRRQLESAANGAAAGGDDQSHSNCNAENTERKESGANRTVFEIEQTKHWPSPTNCSTIPEKTAATTKAMAAAAAAAGGVAESCRAAAEKWIPFDEGEQRRSLLAERNATWQMMHLSCSTPNNTNTIHLMNNNSTSTICSNIVTATSNPITSSCPSTPRTMDHQPKQLFKPKDHLNIFIAPFRSACDQKQHENIVNVIGDDDEEGHGESQTLELFPLRSSSDNNDENIFCDKDEIGAAANSNNNFNGSHYQFFEFLPLKN